jgi:hypothetical protein
MPLVTLLLWRCRDGTRYNKEEPAEEISFGRLKQQDFKNNRRQPVDAISHER